MLSGRGVPPRCPFNLPDDAVTVAGRVEGDFMKRFVRAMVSGAAAAVMSAVGGGGGARAAGAESTHLVTPLDLALQLESPESIYAPPEASSEANAVNAGGVNFTLNAIYFSDYIFRGIDRSETSG